MIPYLQVENLTKSFGDLVLFHEISFGIAQGQRIGLIAKNGSGKTTLMNFLKLRNQVELQFLHPKRKQLARLKILSRIQTAQR